MNVGAIPFGDVFSMSSDTEASRPMQDERILLWLNTPMIIPPIAIARAT
jgi:hypothetical protein